MTSNRSKKQQTSLGSPLAHAELELLVGAVGPSLSPTSRCRSTTCWRSPVPPRESTLVLVIGLAIAIVLMAVASNYIAKLLGALSVDRLDRPADHPLGGARHDLSRARTKSLARAFDFGCSETMWQGILHRLGLTSRLRAQRIDGSCRTCDVTRMTRAIARKQPPRRNRGSSSTARPGRPASRSASGWLRVSGVEVKSIDPALRKDAEARARR